MDEILIEDKKYVSSKQAAKITGYAKDYIGQLCREGRVPARLVGRSWYVLETAIHDHRFGEQKIGQEIKETMAAEAFSPTWEFPRYEASPVEALPAIHRSEDIPASEGGVDGENNEVSQNLQDSWKAWFDRIGDAEPSASIPPEHEKGKKEQETGGREVQVPVHTVYRQPPEELLPRYHASIEQKGALQEVQTQTRGRGRMKVIQMSGALLALLLAILAVLGSGYFDTYILSNSQVGVIAGVASYNK